MKKNHFIARIKGRSTEVVARETKFVSSWEMGSSGSMFAFDVAEMGGACPIRMWWLLYFEWECLLVLSQTATSSYFGYKSAQFRCEEVVLF